MTPNIVPDKGKGLLGQNQPDLSSSKLFNDGKSTNAGGKCYWLTAISADAASTSKKSPFLASKKIGKSLKNLSMQADDSGDMLSQSVGGTSVFVSNEGNPYL